jgi:hypothetical protein
MPHEPISLSDAELSAIMAAATPLHPIDRSAFLSSVAHRLRHEPEMGPGTTNRIIRELLASKNYRLETALAVGSTQGMAKHHTASKLRNGAPVGRARSK